MSTPGGAAHPNAATRLVLVCHAATAATRAAAFPADEPLEHDPGPVRPPLDRIARVHSGPELRCLQTAAALGWRPRVEPALADLDVGTWRGRALHEVDPGTWPADPDATPHGGESLSDLTGRVADWLNGLRDSGERIGAVTHPAVIRATVAHVLGAAPAAHRQIDAVPLSYTVLSASGGRWRLRETGHPLI